MSNHKVPSDLHVPSRDWLEHLLEEHDFTPSEWKLAVLAAQMYDRSQTARRMLNREGLTVTTPQGGVAPHPAVVIARDATRAFSQLAAQLGIDAADEGGPRGLSDALGRRRG